jgi:hypothetical protein
MTSDSTAEVPAEVPALHEDEPHDGSITSRLNWLRAGVLGANDGIVSTAGIVVGVAGATADKHTILIAGVAGLCAGALSMGAGEYVSVSTQRDTEQALLARSDASSGRSPRRSWPSWRTSTSRRGSPRTWPCRSPSS